MSFMNDSINRLLSRPYGRRGFFKLVVAGCGAAAFGSLTSRVPAFATTAESTELNVVVMSDIHVMAPQLFGENEAFHIAENSDRKMFRESPAIFKRALDAAVDYNANLIIVPGDLTKDGEYESHVYVHDLFVDAVKRLADKGVDCQVCVINGNHDLNNANGLDFSKATDTGDAPAATRTSPTMLKSLYDDLCYSKALACFDRDGSAGGSLSYVARPCAGLTLIMVDSCKYSADQNSNGVEEHQTEGMVGSALLSWVQDQAKAARARGDMAIAVQHHGLVAHFDDEPYYLRPYLADDWENLASAYAQAGISCVLTGHMHANDIAQAATQDGGTFYDVETGSLVTYPSWMRTGSIVWTKTDTDVSTTITLDSDALGAVSSAGMGTGGHGGTAPYDITDITAFGKEVTLTTDSIKTMARVEASDPAIAAIAAAGGTKVALAGALASQGVTVDTLDSYAWSLIRQYLVSAGATSNETGLTYKVSLFNLSIFFDESADRLCIQSAQGNSSTTQAFIEVKPESVESVIESLPAGEQAETKAASDQVYETVVAESAADESGAMGTLSANSTLASPAISLYATLDTFTTFLDELFASVDTTLNEGSSVTTLLNAFIDDLCAYPVADGKTLFDLADYCYQDHLLGNETCDAWAESALKPIDGTPDQAGSLYNAICTTINTLQGTTDADGNWTGGALVTFLDTIPLDIKALLVADGFLSGIARSTAANMLKTAGAALSLLKDSYQLGTLAGQNVSKLPATEVSEGIPANEAVPIAGRTLRTLAHDGNVADDHHIVLADSRALPQFSAFQDAQITVGATFDPLDGVTASAGDTDLTARITWKVLGSDGSDVADSAEAIAALATGTYAIQYSVTDDAGDTVQVTRNLVIVPAPVMTATVERLGGETASETAALIAARAFDGASANTVVIARDDAYFDALSGAALAGALDAPILLTRPNELTSACLGEIKALGATKAIVLGGTSAISDHVVEELELNGISVERIGGENAYGTSLAIAKRVIELDGSTTAAIVANPTSFADAVSIGGYAYSTHTPILLQTWGTDARERGFDAEGAALLKDRAIIVCGGPEAVSDDSLAEAGLTASVRLGGETLYDTSIAIANWAIDNGAASASDICIASAAADLQGVDALAACALAGRKKGIVLLAQSNEFYYPPVETAKVLDFLSAHKGQVASVHVLGGAAASTPEFFEDVKAALA